MKMKHISILALFLFSSALLSQAPGGGGTAPAGGGGGAGGGGTGGTGGTTAPKTGAPQQGYYLRVETLENFSDAEDWRAKSTTPLGITKTKKLVQRGPITAADNPNEKMPGQCPVTDKACETDPNMILGVKTYFNDRGFDRVEVYPPHEFVIKGKARQFSVWVLGRKYRHTLSIKLRDYRGKLHKLRLGRLDYFGWRKLTVTVPGWLPQSTRYSMIDKNLHFVSLYVTSDVHEVPGTFYFYMDNLNVLVDRTESVYPGSEIKDNW